MVTDSVFPSTQQTWVEAELARGPAGRDAINDHVMSRYAGPLEIYFHGSSFVSMGIAQEFVNGFFASRLARDGYLEAWQQSNLRLHRWLINGFIFYLREQLKNKSLSTIDCEDLDESAKVAGPVEAFERAWAKDILSDACKNASTKCLEQDRGDDWVVFKHHYIDGRTYRWIEANLGWDAVRAGSMCRFATNILRYEIEGLLYKEGIPVSEIQIEMARLLELLSP